MEPDTPEAADGDELAALGTEFTTLLRQDPELATQVADLIERRRSGGENEGVDSDMPDQEASTNAAPEAPPEMTDMLPYDQRLAGLEEQVKYFESYFADQELTREIETAKSAYEKFRESQGLDALPEWDEAGILQYAHDSELPLEKAAKLWALEQATGGDKPLADLLMQSRLKKDAKDKPPAVMGPGGQTPGPEAAEPAQTPNETIKRLTSLFRGRMAGNDT